MTDWCKVFVLDQKSPRDFALSGPGLVILTVAEQERLEWWGIMTRIPWNHFGRKNVGFLYAALHGAEVIYDTDDDNVVHDNSADWIPRSFQAGAGTKPELVSPASGDVVFNPYPFWGIKGAWPRGFPLSRTNSPTANSGVRPFTPGENGHPQRICVLQSLANADPDVDAIWRLTQDIPLFFPPRNTWLAYPAGTYAPWNAQATLISGELIAGLALPVTVHGRVSDIWRSYILQRAMWGLGCGLAFAAPWVTQYRNAHAYLKDFHAELDLYLKTEGLLQVLSEVDLDGAVGLERLGARVMTIYVALYEHGLLEVGDVLMLFAYLADLGQLTMEEVEASRALLSASAADTVPAAAPSAELQRAQPPQRAAVCLTGHFRGGPFAWPTVKQNVLSALEMPYDVYVVGPAAFRGQAADDFLYVMEPRVVIHPGYNNVEELMRQDGWQLTGFDQTHYLKDWLHEITDLKVCSDAIKNSSVTYTHAVRVRADAMVLHRLPEPLDKLQPNDIVVPDNQGYQGVNDRFAYGGIEGMMTYLTVLDGIPGILADLVAKKDLPPHVEGAEKVLQQHLAWGKVNAIPKEIQICRYDDYKGGKLWCDDYDYATFPECKRVCDEFGGFHRRSRE